MSDGDGCMRESLPSAAVLKWKATNQTEGASALKDDALQLCTVGAHAMTPRLHPVHASAPPKYFFLPGKG